MIAKILVPHDGTEISDKAFERATEFAKVFNAEIALLHVIQDIPIPPSLLLGNDKVLISRAKRSIARELEKGWNKMVHEKIIDVFTSKESRIKVRSEVTVGSSPAEEIIKFADNKQIDIIIKIIRICFYYLTSLLTKQAVPRSLMISESISFKADNSAAVKKYCNNLLIGC